jgi:Flp pilus assembly protein TadD
MKRNRPNIYNVQARIAIVGCQTTIRSIRQLLAVSMWLLALVCPGGGSVNGQAADPSKSVPGDTPEMHLGRGYDALKNDRYDEAVNEFRAALALDPALVQRARFPLAVALFEMHKPEEARREFEEVRREVGEHPNVSYYLGRLDLDGENYLSAIRNLTQAAAKPPFPDTAYYLGFACFKQGDLVAAEKWLKEAAKANPRDSRVQYQLGFVYRKLGRETESRKALALSKELRERDSTESQLRRECAEKLEKGPREEAHAVCEQLYDPNNAERLTALGTLYGQHGDAEAALKPFRRAAELAPQSPQMQYNLAMVYYQLKQFSDAQVPLAGALKRWPDLFQLNALYGAVLLNLGKEQEGYAALRHAHELNPEDAGTQDFLYRAALDLAEKSQEARQYPESLRYLEEAAKVRPKEPAPHKKMAEIYMLTARTAEATAEQREAERLANHSAD